MDRKLEIILAARDMTGKAFNTTVGRIEGLSKKVFSLQGAFAALGAATGIGLVIEKSLNAADAIGKAADKLGITRSALQEYQFAASQSGVETQTLNMALQRFTRRVAEAAQGKGELKDTLRQYNIEVRDAEGRTRAVGDVLDDLADAIRGAESDQERLRIAFKAFDSEGAALVNMLSDGSAGLKSFRHEARDLGLILSDEVIDASSQAVDQFDKLGRVIKTQVTIAVGNLAPKIAELSNKLVEHRGELTQYTEDLLSVGNAAAIAAGKVASFMNQVGRGLGIAGAKVAGAYERAWGILTGKGDMGPPQLGETIPVGPLWRGKIPEPPPLPESAVKSSEVLPDMTEEMGMLNYELRILQLQSEAAWGAFNEKQLEAQAGLHELPMTMEAIIGNVEVSVNQMADEVDRAFSGIDDKGQAAAAALDHAFSGWANSFGDELNEMVWGAEVSFDQIAVSFGKMLTRMAIQKAIIEPLFSIVSMGLPGLGSLFPWAEGGIFDRSGAVRFASGGIVRRPTLFAFGRGGRLGLMGEEGPEAVMPLARTPSGELGVRAQGGDQPQLVNIQIFAVDSKSFNDICRRNPESIVEPIRNALAHGDIPLRNNIRRMF